MTPLLASRPAVRATAVLFGAVALTWATLAGAAPTASAARSAEDQRLTVVCKSLTAKVGAPSAMAQALEVGRALGAVAPGRVVQLLEPAAKRWTRDRKAGTGPVARVLRSTLIQAALAADLADVVAAYAPSQGVVLHWSVLGPFGDEHGSAFAREGEVEQEIEAVGAALTVPLRASFPGRAGRVGWQPVPGSLARPGERVPLETLVERPDDAIVFAQAWFRTVTPGPAVLRLGVDGAARVWLDGRRVLQAAARPTLYGLAGTAAVLPEADDVPVLLAVGWHRLVVKLAPADAALPLLVAFTGSGDTPLAIESRAEPPPLAEAASPFASEPSDFAQSPAPGPADAALGLVWPLAPERAARPGVLATFVALAWHGWPLPVELSERLLAVFPEELPPDPQTALGHAMLAGEPGDRIDRLRAWAELLPDAPELMVAQAQALDEIGKTPTAHQIWTDWTAQHGKGPEESSVRACIVRADLWSRLGADLIASRLLERCGERWPDAPELLAARIRNATAHDRLTEAAQLHARLVEVEPGRLERHLNHLAARIETGDLSATEAIAADLDRRFPGRSRAWASVARARLSLGQAALAMQALDRLPPHLVDSGVLELRARIAARLGQKPLAIELLRSALQRAPARADLRARLQILRPDGDFFAPLRRDLLALVRAEAKLPRPYPFETRLQQTVLQALGNGQQARYEAEVHYVGKGGPTAREVQIEYAPSLSRADVLLAVIVRADGRIDRDVPQTVDRFGEDASGMYYDLERTTLTFRSLRPGDTAVAEYVVRDLLPTPFGLVFGELLVLGDEQPVRETSIAVQLLEGTPFFHHYVDPRRPDAPLLAMTRVAKTPTAGPSDDQGVWDTWTLSVGPLPAHPSEDGMPGVTDVLPYLHLSSFPTWDAAARWFAGLMAEALPAPGSDPMVKELAQRLGAGATTVEQKVRAVHGYVASQIRYVGLEFGIHSLKPHAVREVIQRQFGDCKDQATLMVALLAELGVEARVALVRTSDLGRLHDDVASLGVFNHAIAYVPELDWFVDTTAQHNAPTELPGGDTGGMALVVPPAKGASPQAKLVRMPEFGPERNTRHEELGLWIEQDGAAKIQITWTLQGLPAAEVRARLATAETRRERIEQDLAPRFPGIAVTKVEATGIQPPADRVEVKVEATAPQVARVADGYFAVAPLRPGKPLVSQLARAEGRKHPLQLEYAFRDTADVVVAGFSTVAVRLSSAPQTDCAYGHFLITSQRNPDPKRGNHARIVSSFEVTTRYIPQDGYAAFRTWLTRVDAGLRDETVLGPAPTPDDGRPR